MYKIILLIFLFTSFSSFKKNEKSFSGINHSPSFLYRDEIIEFDQLSKGLTQLKASLPTKTYLNDQIKKSDTISKMRDVDLIDKSIENVAWLKASAIKTQTEISFAYRSSLMKLSVAARQLSDANIFTESESSRLEGMHNDIQAKCETAQANFVTGYKYVTVIVRTANRSNIEKNGYQVCWAYSFDDRHLLNIKKCFAENSSTTTDSLFVPGEYVFWAEKLNKDADGTVVAGPKKYVHINSSLYKLDLYVQ